MSDNEIKRLMRAYRIAAVFAAIFLTLAFIGLATIG